MIPGRSIMTPALIPERSTASKCPSSIRMPAQVCQRLSVGGRSPRDNTQGQNTVQLHDSASSPFKLQLSVNAQLPPYSISQSVRGDQPPVKVVRTITAPTAISTTP